MRIALIAPPWLPVPPPAYGGTESVIDTLARGLAAAGHEVILATTGDSTCPVERTWFYERSRVEEIGHVVFELPHLLHAYRAVADADVVHDHSVAGPLLAERFRVGPVVTTNHGPFTDETLAIYREIAATVPIVAISHHHARTAGRLPIARVIHHGIDVERFPVGDGSSGHLLFLGRMSPTKGVREAIEVARRADAPLLIAAKMRERPEREYFEQTIEPLLGDGIEYVGEVGGAEKLALLGGASALLNPIAWDEPFGLCMIEAMACGTPVLVTPRGAAPELVDHGRTGLICETVDELVNAVRLIPELDRRSCRAEVEERFSARRMVEDHLVLYDQVLRRNSWPRWSGYERPLEPTVPS